MARSHLTIPNIFQVDFPSALQTKLTEHDTALDALEAGTGLASGSVTAAKLAAGAAASNLGSGGVTSSLLAAGAALANLGGAFSPTGVTQQTSAGSGGAVKVDSTSTGGTGSTAYTTGDVIAALKARGILAA